MKRTIIILTTLITLSLTGMAQDKANRFYTCGYANGIFWGTSDQEGKNNYVVGFMEGHPTFTGAVASLNQLSYGALSHEVDAFYSHYSTIMPISDAIYAIGLRLGGDVKGSETYVNISLNITYKECQETQSDMKK